MPGVPAAGIDDLIEYMRLDTGEEYSSELGLLNRLLLSASSMATKYMRRALITATYKRQFIFNDKYSGLDPVVKTPEQLMLPYPPIESITSVKQISEAGSESTITSYTADIEFEPGSLYLGYTPGYMNKILVEYEAGYGESYDAVPEAIQQGIIQLACYMYQRRGDCNSERAVRDSGAAAIFDQYKVALV